MSTVAHYALDRDLTLKEATLKLDNLSENEFDRVVDPAKVVHPGTDATEASLIYPRPRELLKK